MSGADSKRTVVVLGASPTGLYAIREASKFGFDVAVADTGVGCAFYSKYVRTGNRRFRGSFEEIEAWLSGLASDAQDKPVLIPTNDVFIEFLVEQFEMLKDRFRMPAAYSGLAAKLLDKKQFHEICVEHGVATPRVWSADGRRALLTLADDLPFPCLLKPALIHRARDFLSGRKVLIARSREEFNDLVDAIPGKLGSWLVQEIVPGSESEITLFGGYIDSSGKQRQAFSARKVRQYPPGFGSASLVASLPCEETVERTLAFLESVGFRGICGAEFKRDPRDGVLKIIEINPRPTLWFQIAHDSGKRIVEALIADLTRGEQPDDEQQDPQVRWRYALKDAFSALLYIRKGNSFVLPRPKTSSMNGAWRRSWPVFAWDDIRPALYEPLGYLKKFLARLR